MKHCISIIEVLVKTVIVETNETGAESLGKAIDRVKKAYNDQEIVLCADDLAPNPTTGEPAYFDEADWIEPEEVMQKEADFTL
jgi:hypothetical protein